MNSAILDKSGKPYEVKSASDAPNLDPDFWLMDSGSSDATVKSMLDKPYKHHVWVHACVRAIIQNISQLSRYLQSKDGSTTVEHPVLSLLDRPNKLMTKGQFMRAVLCHLLLPTANSGGSPGGQCFIIPWSTKKDDKVNLQKGEIPDELFPYPDNYFEPWYGAQSKGRAQINGWHFRIP